MLSFIKPIGHLQDIDLSGVFLFLRTLNVNKILLISVSGSAYFKENIFSYFLVIKDEKRILEEKREILSMM